MYAVISGELEVIDEPNSHEKEGFHGTKKLISILRTGDVVGEMGMVRHCQRSATVAATTQTELLEINEKMMQRLQWLYPPTAQKFFFNLMTIICNRLEKTTQYVSQLKTLDDVTGLHDRSYFENTLYREIVRAQRYDMPVSMLLVEVDHLGELSASYGQETGNRVLSEMGRMLERNIRRSDTACRFGGAQFAVVLPNSTAGNTRRTCERLRKLFDKHPFEPGSCDIHLTVSIGFATLNPDLSESTTDLITKASTALQRARQRGGNRVDTVG
jgi:diguanylate cyclase (GGDEF)-like protein